MTVDVPSASQTSPVRATAEEERDLLYLIGRALIEHKDRFYVCHRTGLTAELAWPIMESILTNIRPYLASAGARAEGMKLLPLEPTAEMIRAALQASVLVQQLYGENIHPDSPGDAASEMVRTVWGAMLAALPQVTAGSESPACQLEPSRLPRLASYPRPIGYEEANVSQPLALLSRAGQMLKSRTHSLLSAAGRGWHSSKATLARD